MTLYLSVTPHIEPTHTQWDHEGGAQLPYRYGGATRAERAADPQPPSPLAVLIEQHLAATAALAQAAQANAAAQTSAAADLRTALASADPQAVHAATDAMWASFHALYGHLQASERAWNELAPAAASD
jgi:hypothetical protein